MAIKDLLVAYDSNESSISAAKFAARMAEKYGAAITGIHIYTQVKYESHVRHWIPEDVIKNVRDAAIGVEKSVADSFTRTIEETGFKGKMNWISSEGRPDTLMPRYARYFDMLITGQFSNVDSSGGGSVSPEELLLRSGKPIIVVPQSFQAIPLKEEAAVAWDGSRSAARALTDAMQILETKNRLDVIRLISSDEDEAKRVLPEHDLVAHLELHGINANLVQIKQGRQRAGQVILDHCQKTKPDVLVMGAYGRGKFGTLLFGSTAQYVLKHMTVPVLLSH